MLDAVPQQTQMSVDRREDGRFFESAPEARTPNLRTSNSAPNLNLKLNTNREPRTQKGELLSLLE